MATAYHCDACGVLFEGAGCVRTHEDHAQSVTIQRPDHEPFSYSFRISADRDLCAACLEAGLQALAPQALRPVQG